MKRFFMTFLFIASLSGSSGNAQVTRVPYPYNFVLYDNTVELDSPHSSIAAYDTSSVIFGKSGSRWYLKFLNHTGNQYFYLSPDGDLQLAADRSLNFGNVIGEQGYGIRDSSGVLQYKNSAGNWKGIGSSDAVVSDSLDIFFRGSEGIISGEHRFVSSGAGLSQVEFLTFDASVDEEVLFHRRIRNYTGGTVSAEIDFCMVSATTGSVVWSVEVMAVGEDESILTAGFAGPLAGTIAVPATAGCRKTAVITFSQAQADNLTHDDYLYLRLKRDADNVNDDAPGDAKVLGVLFHE